MRLVEYLRDSIGCLLRGHRLASYRNWLAETEYEEWYQAEGYLHWLCWCGHYIEDGLHCEVCGSEPPWGCYCVFCNDPEDEWTDPDDNWYPDCLWGEA